MNSRSDRFQKPANALKRAEELIAVGQRQQACAVLHEVLVTRRAQAKERKHQATFEQIMQKYLELCVQLRETKRSKDALHQYKSLCNTIGSMNSLSVVIKRFLRLAEERTEQGQTHFEAQKLKLEGSSLSAETKASQLLLEVSGEGLQGRLERQLVTPWHKFLWDSYRCVLEILRNIPSLEDLYHETAHNALKFCVQYRRKTEFRRLADTLRFHLKSLEASLRTINMKAEQDTEDDSSSSSSSSSASSASSSTLTTAAAVAASMISTRDDQDLVNLSQPKTQNAQLETRFMLLHSACELGLWNEGFKAIEDIKRVLNIRVSLKSNESLADFRAPFYRRFMEKLAHFFWAAQNPTFHAFFLQKYFDLLPPEERTADICSALLLAGLAIELQGSDDSEAAAFDFDDQQAKNTKLAVTLGVSVPPSRDALLSQLTSLSGAYDLPNHVLPELRDLFDIVERRFHPLELCQAVKPKLDVIAAHPTLHQYAGPLSRLVLVRLFQQLGQVYSKMQFANLRRLAFFFDFYTLETTAVDAVRERLIDVRFDHQAGVLHFNSRALASDDLRNELTKLAHQLQVAQQLINPDQAHTAVAQRRAVFQRIVATIDEEHEYFLERSIQIERRKEKTEQDAQKKLEEKRARDAEEAARVAEQRAAEEERNQKEREKIKAENKSKRKAIVPSATPGLVDTAEPVAAPSVLKIIADLNAARERTAAHYKQLSQELDHFERAKREEERTLVMATLNSQSEKDRQYQEEQAASQLEEAKAKHAKDLADKKQLVVDNERSRAKFEEAVVGRQRAIYEGKLRTHEERKRMLEERLARAEERRAVEEEADRRRKEEEEEQRQLKREEEERKKAEAARPRGGAPVPIMTLRNAGGTGGSSWRDREANKDRERESGGGRYVPPSYGEREREREPAAPGRYVPPSYAAERERPSPVRSGERPPVAKWEPPSRTGGSDRDRERERERDPRPFRESDSSERPREPVPRFDPSSRAPVAKWEPPSRTGSGSGSGSGAGAGREGGGARSNEDSPSRGGASRGTWTPPSRR